MAEQDVYSLRDAELASLFFDTISQKMYRRVRAEGEFVFSGLGKRFYTTTKVIGDTEIALPPSILADRNSFCIHNKGPNTLYVGETGVTADSVDGSNTSGWEIFPNSYFNLDVKSTVSLYGVCETGKTTTIKILELS